MYRKMVLKRSTLTAGAWLTAVMTASGIDAARASAQAPQTAKQPATQSAATGSAAAQPGAVSLRPGDIVKLRIWREPDLSGDFPVDESGSVVFPKIGSVAVNVITPDSLKRFLIGTYSGYLRDPSIDVTLLRRVIVSGAVRNPGLYPADATTTVADVLALAGGATQDGRRDQVDIRRDGKTVATRLSSRTRLSESTLHSGDQLYVPERGWASRNTAVVTAVISALGFVTATIITR